MVKRKEVAIGHRKLLESCIGNERDCCKIVIFGIKREYLSNWRILFLGVNNS